MFKKVYEVVGHGRYAHYTHVYGAYDALRDAFKAKTDLSLAGECLMNELTVRESHVWVDEEETTC